MSQATSHLQEKSQALMDGPLKHIRGAALAAALVPLASVFATPAAAQTVCASAGVICGTVYSDTNGNGIFDSSSGETGIANQEVDVYQNGVLVYTVFTDAGGNYITPFVGTGSGTYTVAVLIPTNDQPSPIGADNVGTSNGAGSSVATGVLPNGVSYSFGFVSSQALNPGTGTPGYWKNHPNAWPVDSITVGGVTYTKAQAIAWLGNVNKDRTTAMFASLVPAMLNVMIGNDGSCVSAAIAAGDSWMATYPLGSGVGGGSAAWQVGDPIHNTLDAYNNGLLCAPHRK